MAGAPSAPQQPHQVRELLEFWDLTLEPLDGGASSVFPVQGAHGPAVLKLARPGAAIRDEARALTGWDGQGAVRLLAAEPSRSALLLERLDPHDLTGPKVTVLDSCEEIGRLARVLDRPAPPWLKHRASDHLRSLAADIDSLRASPDAHALPRRMLERGRTLALDLATEPDIDARLVHADLHHEHVLWRPDPGEWVAVAPDPIAADPTWVAAPALWHRWTETAAAYDLRIHLNFRLDVICEVADLDPDRARVVCELRTLSSAVGHIRIQPPDLADSLTRHVSIIKALQPA